MVKKRLANGDPCEKCAQTEDMLRRRGLWGRIHEVVWAQEGDDQSPGVELGRTHGVAVAPFFVLTFDDGREAVYTSAMRLIRDHFSEASVLEQKTKTAAASIDIAGLEREVAELDPESIVRLALERFGARCAVVLTGAEDVVLVDMAVKTGLAFRTVFVDSGRLHTQTYKLIDDIARHYGIEIHSTLPDRDKLIAMVNEKGQNSFLQEGHVECCGIRRVEPLTRALANFDAFMALQGMGRELAAIRSASAVELDVTYGEVSKPRVRFSPLRSWDSNQIWSYVRKHAVPHNELHVAGYRFIGCQPCTRVIRRDQESREGLWWWETPEREKSEKERLGDGI